MKNILHYLHFNITHIFSQFCTIYLKNDVTFMIAITKHTIINIDGIKYRKKKPDCAFIIQILKLNSCFIPVFKITWAKEENSVCVFQTDFALVPHHVSCTTCCTISLSLTNGIKLFYFIFHKLLSTNSHLFIFHQSHEDNLKNNNVHVSCTKSNLCYLTYKLMRLLTSSKFII